MAETEEGNSSPPGLWYALCIKKPQYKFPHTAAKGLKYDFVANVMSSFKDEKHKHRKLKYKENVGVTSDDIISDNKNIEAIV